MTATLSTLGRWLAPALAMTLIGGCCCTVHVVAHDEADGHGGRPWNDGGAKNGGPHDAGIKVMRFHDADYAFQSRSTITPRGEAVRLRLTSADPAPTPPCAPETYPDFLVHYQATQAHDPVTVDFASPPMVDFVSGWMYFNGKAPIGKTRRVRAIGSGTEMIIEIGPDADYVYLVNEADSHVFVYALLSDTPDEICQTLDFGMYTRVDDKGVCSEPQTYFDNGDRQRFVREALIKVSEQPW